MPQQDDLWDIEGQCRPDTLSNTSFMTVVWPPRCSPAHQLLLSCSIECESLRHLQIRLALDQYLGHPAAGRACGGHWQCMLAPAGRPPAQTYRLRQLLRSRGREAAPPRSSSPGRCSQGNRRLQSTILQVDQVLSPSAAQRLQRAASKTIWSKSSSHASVESHLRRWWSTISRLPAQKPPMLANELPAGRSAGSSDQISLLKHSNRPPCDDCHADCHEQLDHRSSNVNQEWVV